MSAVCQLDFFCDEPTQMDLLRDEVADVRHASERVRRGMFARHGDLERKYAELAERLAILERNICTGDSTKLFQS